MGNSQGKAFGFRGLFLETILGLRDLVRDYGVKGIFTEMGGGHRDLF